jgi:two-component system cell cycle response regulator CtrA
MRVLLIEDEPTTAKSIELMLGSEGFNVYMITTSSCST